MTRFGLALLSVPVVVASGGILLGLIGRWLTGRRGGPVKPLENATEAGIIAPSPMLPSAQGAQRGAGSA